MLVKLSLACLLLIPAGASSFCFDEAGKTYGINPELLKVIARTESNLRPHALNKNNNGTWDIGLMQINSSWVKSLKLDPALLLSDPCYNLKTGASILRKCIDHYGYTWEAIGCYNATSMHKKMRYSWKIYERLKKERVQSSELRVKSSESPNSELRTPDSKLYFRIRDREER